MFQYVVTSYSCFSMLLHRIHVSVCCYIVFMFQYVVTLYSCFSTVLHCIHVSVRCYTVFMFQYVVTLYSCFSMLLQEDGQHTLRLGSMVLHNIGQLLPHQMAGGKFNTRDYIYPVRFLTF